jgi:hypothetical protein
MRRPSVALASGLNALGHGWTAARVARAVVGEDLVHHVVDPQARLGLDPEFATDLTEALPVLAAAEPDHWVLALPTPGRLAPLRGPVELNGAAVAMGEAVVGATAGLALVPYRVGHAVQWRVFSAEAPAAPATPYEAERALAGVVIRAARVLTELDVAAGRAPAAHPTGLVAGADPRRRALAERAELLLIACQAALTDDGGAISSYEADARCRQLREVDAAARDALCAAASWPVG